MARTVTIKMLENLCIIINEKFHNNAGETGSFFISQQCGGVNLCRRSTNHGASDAITSGHKPKRELYNQMLGFVRLHDLMKLGA